MAITLPSRFRPAPPYPARRAYPPDPLLGEYEHAPTCEQAWIMRHAHTGILSSCRLALHTASKKKKKSLCSGEAQTSFAGHKSAGSVGCPHITPPSSLTLPPLPRWGKAGGREGEGEGEGGGRGSGTASALFVFVCACFRLCCFASLANHRRYPFTATTTDPTCTHTHIDIDNGGRGRGGRRREASDQGESHVSPLYLVSLSLCLCLCVCVVVEHENARQAERWAGGNEELVAEKETYKTKENYEKKREFL